MGKIKSVNTKSGAVILGDGGKRLTLIPAELLLKHDTKTCVEIINKEYDEMVGGHDKN